MTAIDRQARFPAPRTSPKRCASTRRARNYLARDIADFAGPLTVQPVQGRAVQSDLSAGNAAAAIRVAQKAARQIAAFRARGRPRISRHPRASRAGLSGRRAADSYCDDAGVVGTPFYVMALRRRPRVLGAADARLVAAERAAIYDAMNATLARLHRFDPAAIGLGDFGRGENYVARQVDRWSKQYRASETETIDAMERLIEWLPHIFRRQGRRGWCTATTGWTICHSKQTRRACARCSTGNYRRLAIRWRISPIT